MAKNKAELEARLKELDSKIKIKADHDISDLEAFIELEELRMEAAKPAQSLPADLKRIQELENDFEEVNEALRVSESQNSKTVSFPTGKVGKDTYEVVTPKFSIKGRSYTAKQASEDVDVLKELVSRNSSAVRKVEL